MSFENRRGPKFEFSAQELIDAGRIEEGDLKKLMVWLKNEMLPCFSEEMMAVFHMACSNNVEETKKCARAFYLTRRDAPELFNARDLSRNDIRQQLSVLQYCVMPKRTPEGYVVVMHRLVNPYPPEYQMDVAMKLLFMAMDTAIYKDPPTGLIVLFDMRGVSLRHLTRIKLSAVKKFFTYVQDALPLQLQACHVINCVWFIDKILSMIKPFFNPQLLEYLHLHKPDMDMDNFFENCIPKSCLPLDLGGDLPLSQEIHETTIRAMEEMQEFFDKEEVLRS